MPAEIKIITRLRMNTQPEHSVYRTTSVDIWKLIGWIEACMCEAVSRCLLYSTARCFSLNLRSDWNVLIIHIHPLRKRKRTTVWLIFPRRFSFFIVCLCSEQRSVRSPVGFKLEYFICYYIYWRCFAIPLSSSFGYSPAVKLVTKHINHWFYVK